MFNYIIIGAGSAGCVLANRLTENKANKILLLEAGGPDEKKEIHIPAAFSKLFKSEVDWEYYSTPQPQLNGRKLFMPRGKTLGGSSSINAMIYIRGHRADYDGWAALGNNGWSYQEVLPYFKRSEEQRTHKNEFHGLKGGLRISDLICKNELSEAFVKGAQEIGYDLNNDFNGAEQEGFGFYQVTQKFGKRHSTAAAFLEPAIRRPNLTTITHAEATKLLFEGKKVTGVEYQQGGELHQVFADAEVVLCGGTINTPKLLMHSGIGEGKHLQEIGIDTLHHLNGVGKNLQDHLFGGIMYRTKKEVTLDSAEDLFNVFGNLFNHLFFREGPFTSNVAEAGGFIKTTDSLPAPDIQFHFAPAFFLEHGTVKPKGNGFSIAPTLLTPKSRGFIKLQSNNPNEYPLINPQHFTNEEDIKTLIEGYKVGWKIMNSEAFAGYRDTLFMPEKVLQTDDEIAEHLRNSVEALYHPIGTCKMGNDSEAVVDSELKVHGIENLRIADASIMPIIPRGNTNAPTIMIAEKAADLILKKQPLKVWREEVAGF